MLLFQEEILNSKNLTKPDIKKLLFQGVPQKFKTL